MQSPGAIPVASFLITLITDDLHEAANQPFTVVSQCCLNTHLEQSKGGGTGAGFLHVPEHPPQQEAQLPCGGTVSLALAQQGRQQL